MPWQCDPTKPRIGPNDKILVCYDIFSPAARIMLNPDSGVAEISFNQTLNKDAVSSSPNKAASLAIATIKCLNIPFEINRSSYVFKEYKISNYRENLPKIIIFLDPDGKNALNAALDDVGAFDAPLAQQPSIAATTRPKTSGKAVFFSEQVETFHSKPKYDPVLKEHTLIQKDESAAAKLKESVKGRKKVLKHASQYSNNEFEEVVYEQEPTTSTKNTLQAPS